MKLCSHSTEGQQLQQPGVMEAAESALAQTACAEGPPVAMEASSSSAAEADLGAAQTSGSCEAAALRCSGKLWSAQRSDCHTTMCSLHSSAPTPLNRQCKEPFKCQSSRETRTKCFLFLSLRSLTNQN